MFLLNFTIPGAIVQRGSIVWPNVERVIEEKKGALRENRRSSELFQARYGRQEIYFTDDLGWSPVIEQGNTHFQYEGTLASSLPLPKNKLALDHGAVFIDWEGVREPELEPEIINKHVSLIGKEGNAEIMLIGIPGKHLLIKIEPNQDGSGEQIYVARGDKFELATTEEKFHIQEALELKRLYWLMLKQVKAPLEVQEKKAAVYFGL